MARKLKLLTGLSAVALTGALALSGCGGEGEGQAEGEGEQGSTAISTEGEGVAEGEGVTSAEGEGESVGSIARTGDPSTDDVEYIKRLGLIQGHLLSFAELYRAGAFEMALPHAKHPESELYAGLVPAFEARGTTGFADELEGLVQVATDKGDIEAPFQEVTTAINANMPAHNTKTVLLAVSQMINVAAEEFGLGVGDDGAIVNAHEYQDAYGFVVSARAILASEDTNDINAAEAIAIAHEQIDAAMTSFDGLTVDSTQGMASTLYGAASRIEIAALGL